MTTLSDSARPRACIMGHPVAHSRSPMLHGYWLRTLGIDGSYEHADVPPEEFEAFFRGLKRNGFVGGNITIPHKEAAFRLVDRRERAADAIGAVNTVWYEGDTLVGGNTDWLGIVGSLDDMHPSWDSPPGSAEKLALVLGAGGSARASVFAFLERGFSVSIVNRTRERAEKLAAAFGPRCSVHDWAEVPALLARGRRADQQHIARHGGQAAARYRSFAAEKIRHRLRCGVRAARDRAAQSRESSGAIARSMV